MFLSSSNSTEYTSTLKSSSLQQEYQFLTCPIETTKNRTECKTYVQNGMLQSKCLNNIIREY